MRLLADANELDIFKETVISLWLSVKYSVFNCYMQTPVQNDSSEQQLQCICIAT